MLAKPTQRIQRRNPIARSDSTFTNSLQTPCDSQRIHSRTPSAALLYGRLLRHCLSRVSRSTTLSTPSTAPSANAIDLVEFVQDYSRPTPGSPLTIQRLTLTVIFQRRGLIQAVPYTFSSAQKLVRCRCPPEFVCRCLPCTTHVERVSARPAR